MEGRPAKRKLRGLAVASLALLVTLPSARAQEYQPTPPISSELPTRLEQRRARDDIREAKPLVVQERELLPAELTLRSVEGQVSGVDAKRGELRIEDESGTRILRTDPATVIELDGRPTASLVGVAPGAEVRASYTPGGLLREVEVRPLPEPRDEVPIPLERLPHTNATARNPSAPEPTSDPQPGNQPGGLPP